MDRRKFLTVGTQAAVLAGTVVSMAPANATESKVYAGAPAVGGERFSPLRDYGEPEHRRRLENIGFCTKAISGCMRKHLVTDYLPAQSLYNLGEYPSLTPWNPDEQDEQELNRLKEHGIQVLQVFDDWNDSLQIFGGDKYTAVNPKGYRKFIEMAHQRGMKVLTYTSACFLERAHPEWRQEWSLKGDNLVTFYWDMARNSPASPGWRNFVFHKYIRIMEEYGSDGLYSDGGYVTNARYKNQIRPLAQDAVPAFEETPQYDGAFTDFLALVYSEVKRHGGIFKVHVDGALQPESGGLKVYDYLWVGEGVSNADTMREVVKNFPPYVVPALDMGYTTIENQDEPYLHAIPYMQFPVLSAGRKFTGERATIPGIKYHDGGVILQRCLKARELWQTDPSKLHAYSMWDAVPGSAETRPTHERWLKRYLPMVEEGTWAWLEINESSLFTGTKPQDIVVSVFANREIYLVLANYGQTETSVETTADYISTEEFSCKATTHFTIPRRSLLILRRDSKTK